MHEQIPIFLLYVYDNMRNKLVEKSDFSNPERNKVQDVLQKSKETALQRYEHPIYDTELGLGPVGWYKLILRTPVQFSPQQFSVFRAVHQWRDTLSRKEDESPFFIMPNHAVFSVARTMPLDKPALFVAIQHVSHIVRANANDLVNVVTEAKNKGATGPELIDVLKKIADLQEADLAKSEAPRKLIQPHTASIAQTAPITRNTVLPAIRAPASGFWGRVWHQSQPHQQRNMSTMNIDLALPLPPLTAEIFVETNGITEASIPERSRHTFVPKEERPAADERVDLFVVKQLGGHKRKRAGPEGSSSGQPSSAQGLDAIINDEIMLDGDEADAEKALFISKKRPPARQPESKRRRKKPPNQLP